MNRTRLQLDPRRRSVGIGGRTTVLQEKSWQVLELLIASAPETVTRADLINNVWQGNFLTGEKGLNQAIWAIRGALEDHAQEPRFIRTLPRTGYRWIATNAAAGNRNRAVVAAGIAAIAAAGIAVAYTTSQPASTSPIADDSRVATRAYVVGRDVHVEYASGCLGIMKNESRVTIGTPVISDDGKEVAVSLYRPEGCHLVTIDVTNGERRDFGQCPVG